MLFVQDLLISWLQQRAWSNAVQIWHKWDSSDCCLCTACVSVIYHHLSWCIWNCSRTPRLKAWDEQVIDTFEVPTLFFWISFYQLQITEGKLCERLLITYAVFTSPVPQTPPRTKYQFGFQYRNMPFSTDMDCHFRAVFSHEIPDFY